MKKNVFLCLLLICMFTISANGQTNYFVSTTGNNSNAGTSTSQAWKTIQYAADNVSVGDTVNILQGTYNEKININVSGDSENYITFRGSGDADVILSGSSLPAYEYIMKIEGQEYLCFTGLKFYNYQELDAIGLLIINSSYLAIVDNEFSDIDYANNAVGDEPRQSQNSQPIIVFGRDPNNPIEGLLFSGNSIHDCETGWSEALSINGNVDGFEISHNLIYDNTNIGIVAIGFEGECSNSAYDYARNGHIHHNLVHDNPSAYAACAGIYIDGASYMLIENNTLYNNDYGIEIGCENNGDAPNDPSANNIIVQNNVIYNNSFTGIALGGYDYPSSGKVESTIIRNNTCFNNDTEDNYNGEIMISYTLNSIVENNIFYTNNTEHVLMISENPNNSVIFNYNLFYTPSGNDDIVIEWDGEEYNSFSDYQSGTSLGANSIFANPLFVSSSISSPNLHIQESSPARNAGNPTYQSSTAFDIDDEKRVSQNIVDIGADEIQSTVSIFSPTEAEELFCYPNPTSGIISFNMDIRNIQSIRISDLLGKIVNQRIELSTEGLLDISDFGNGIYIISVQTEKETVAIKILKM